MGTGRASADQAAKDILHAVVLATTMQTGSYIPPSDAGHPIIKRSPAARGRTVSAGIILDYLFIFISNPSPSEDWYCRVLAARDTIYDHWIAHPRPRSPAGTLILTFLCNVAGILDMCLFSLLKTNPTSLMFPPLSPTIKEILKKS